jgi:hypothetical protein
VEIVPLTDDKVFLFKQGIAVFQTGIRDGNPTTGTYGAINKTGKVILEPVYSSIRVQDNGLLIVEKVGEPGGFIQDVNGNIIYQDNGWGISDYSDGLAIVHRKSDNVYINEKGQEVLQILTSNPSNFIDGIALVNEGTSFIDKTGKEVEELQKVAELRKTTYDMMSNFYDGVSVVRKGELYGFIDRSGKEIFAPQFVNTDSVDTFNDDGLLIAYDQNNKSLILSKSGKVYDDYTPIKFKEGMTPVGKAGKWGFVDKKGNEIVKPTYDEVSGFSGGLAQVKKNGKLGYVDQTGKEVVKPDYDELNSFVEGLLLVKKNGLFGYVDESGNEAITPQFEEAESFSEGLANVKIEGRWGYIIHPLGTSTIEPLGTEIADWAKAEVQTAIDSGLVPLFLQTDYGVNITREDFCALIVRFIEVRFGKPIEDVLTEKGIKFDKGWSRSEFSDMPFGTQATVIRRPILAAVAMGIMNGKGKKENGFEFFDPKGKITRQEAAVTLARTASFLGLKSTAAKSSFQDKRSIASWANQAVDWAYAKEIMNGVDGGRFAPQEFYSRQQAYMTIVRFHQMFN